MSVARCLFLLMLFPLSAWGQGVSGGGEPGLGAAMKTLETNRWVIFGRTTTMRGEPLGGVTVRVDIGTGIGSVQVVTSNMQGEFRTEFNLDASMYRRVNVKLVASKPGYADAYEAEQFEVTDRTSGVELVLRELGQEPDQLSVATLANSLAPRLRREATTPREAGAKELVRGCEELFDRHNAAAALSLLSKGVERAPTCVQCRALLALAMLKAGGWTSARRQLSEALKLNEAAAEKRPEPALIAGVLEAWQGQPDRAMGFFQKALTVEPDHALALQEMGRALVAQKNWEAADEYLEKAIRAGASDQARLLRVRALLEVGDVAEAGREMERYIAGRDMKSLPSAARILYIEVQDHLNLKPYAKTKSVLTLSFQDLLEAMPELKGIRLASNQDELEAVIGKVGEGVEAFLKSFPNTVSLEHVHQERLGKDGTVKHSLDQDFQYLLLARAERWGLDIDEYRTTSLGESTSLKGLDQGLMLTAGFASTSLLFHPAYQDGTSFRYLGRQSLEGRDMHVIAFAQKPDKSRIMARFKSNEGSAVVLLQGVAWIDPVSFQILRLRSDLLAPQSKVRLQRQTTEIQFKEVQFKELAGSFWFPQEVAVTVDWRGRIFRNWHRYSDFKLFNVEATETRKVPSLPAAPSQKK